MMIKTKIPVLLLLLVLLAAAFSAYQIIHNKMIRKKGTVTLHTFCTAVGWGYKININDSTYVYQPFIPVIETHLGFETQEMAENAGRIVMKKIINREQPILTLEDLQKVGVKINGDRISVFK